MPKAAVLFTVASCWVFCFLATEAEAQNERGCTNLRTLASMGPQVSDDRQDSAPLVLDAGATATRHALVLDDLAIKVVLGLDYAAKEHPAVHAGVGRSRLA
jgi:hypothetical protein